MARKRPRLAAFDYRGRNRYFLTVCTRLRQNLFTDAATVEMVLTQILRSAAHCEFDVTAYVFLPDHLHMLVHGRTPGSDLRAFVKLAKQTSGFAYGHARNGDRLWQPSYYDRVLREDEPSAAAVAYILQNPVVAGLVTRWEEYPFVGSATYGLAELALILQEGRGSNWE